MKNLSSSTEDDVVQFLRSNYPHYQRTKADTLRFSVRKLLLESPPRKPQKTSVSSPSTSVGSGDEEGEASRKKPRRGNESEERLRRMEIARLQRIRPSQEADGSSESEGSKSSDDESGETSESEDAIYDAMFRSD